MSSWTPFNYNHECPFHSHSTSAQTRNNSHHGRKYMCTISKWGGPGGLMLSVSPPQFACWIDAFPQPWLCWLNLCIHPDICFGFRSSFQTPSGYRAFPCTQAHLAGALTSCLVLTGSSMEAGLSYPRPPATQGGSTTYRLKPQLHPSHDF